MLPALPFDGVVVPAEVVYHLQDFPSEVLSEIASYLDFADVLSLQQTSRRLRECADARIVWFTLAKKYSARHLHLVSPEAGAVEGLKTDEMREWIRRRLVVDEIWKAPIVQPHLYTLPDPSPNVLKLVPGGRWLLVGYHCNYVYYHDLDSRDLKRLPLIQPSKDMDGGLQDVNTLEVYVDRDEPVLQFKLAISGIDPMSTSTEVRWLHIWQVRLQGGDSLAAEWLVSIPINHYGARSRTLAIGQHLLARTVTLRYLLSWVEVYCWRQCSSTRVLRTVFPVDGVPERIYVIGDRILCIQPPATVELYDFLDPGYVDLEQVLEHHQNAFPHNGNNLLRKPLWSHSFSGDRKPYFSPLYYDGTTHLLVVSTGRGIWGLTFSKLTENRPSVTRLSTYSSQTGVCLPGICKAYAIYGDGDTGVRIGYGWDNEMGIPSVRYMNGDLKATPLHGIQPAFDEEGGRIVYLKGDRRDMTIVDLVKRDYIISNP